GQPGISRGIGRILIDGLLEIDDRLRHVLRGSFVPEIAAAQVEVVGIGVDRAFPYQFELLLGGEAQLHLARDGFAKVSLHVKNVVEVAVEVLGPDMGLVLDADQLGADANFSSFLARAALQYVIRPELLADLASRLLATLIGHSGGTGDDSEFSWA